VRSIVLRLVTVQIWLKDWATFNSTRFEWTIALRSRRLCCQGVAMS